MFFSKHRMHAEGVLNDRHGRCDHGSTTVCSYVNRLFLPLNHVGHFCDERAIDQIAREGVAAFVVHEEKVAQWTMDDIEADIRTPLALIAVVLDERIEKYTGRCGIIDASRDQIRLEMTVRKADVVVRVV